MTIVELYNRSARPRGYSKAVVSAANVPGLVWDANTKEWRGYPDAIETLKSNLVGVATTIDRRTSRLPFSPQVPDLFRPYQKDGVRFLVEEAPTGALLADAVGLGKTAQTIATALTLRPRRTLVLCPAVAKYVWAREFMKWAGSLSQIVEGTKQSLEFTMPVIVNYDVIHAYPPQPLDLLVLDEVHYLMNQRSRRSGAVKSWAALADLRIGLSATPMTTRPRDLWNVVDTISPGRFGSDPWRYFRRYCDAHKETVDKFGTTVWKLDGASNVEELSARLKHFMLRRTKAEVMTDLPPQTRQVVELDVPDTAKVMIAFEDDKRAVRRALDLAGAAKIPQAVALAKDVADSNVVLFTHLKDTAHRLGKALKAPVVTGEVAQADRHALVASKPPIVVATIDSMTVSIDLSYANVLIFVDLDYVPSKLLQAEGRLHRSGQVRPVTIYYLVALGTLDEQVRSTVIDRLHLYEKILGDADAGKFGKDLAAAEDLPLDEDALLAAMRKAVVG